MLLQVDLKNAFNSIARSAILESLERLSQSMLPWVRQAFRPVFLFVGQEVIWSTRGAQQGDPPGPVLFSAGIHTALDAIHRWDLKDTRSLHVINQFSEVSRVGKEVCPHSGEQTEFFTPSTKEILCPRPLNIPSHLNPIRKSSK